MRRVRARLLRVTHALIPFVVGAFLVLVVLGEGDQRRDDPPWVLIGMAAAVGQAVALYVWRRSRPERAMAVALAGGLYIQLLAPEGTIPAAGVVAIWSLAAARPPRVSLPWLVLLLGVAAVSLVEMPPGDAAFAMTLAFGAWALGEAARNRRAAIEEEARRAVTEEQARIARELHDVIAHSVSVIVVQAGAADDVFDARPDQARAALRSIEAAGRDALGELRRLLAAVRPGGEVDGTHPQPGLVHLDELAEPLRAAGLQVAVRREGPAASLPAGVDLSAYRIVQEALTNTLRHAEATRADVTVRYERDAVEVSVRDDGRGGASPPRDGGHGIVGMRERATMLGGTLEAGPLAGGGFRVLARLPLEVGR